MHYQLDNCDDGKNFGQKISENSNKGFAIIFKMRSQKTMMSLKMEIHIKNSKIRFSH